MTKKAFTLIEVLVVFLLITLIISLIGPKGYILYESVEKKFIEKEKNIEIQKQQFKSFLMSHDSEIYGNKINKNGILVDEKK